MRRLLTGLLLGATVFACPRAGGADDPPGAAVPKAREARRGRGQRDDPRFVADRDVFHFLLDNRAKIERAVTPVEGGVETVTESDDAEVADAIRTHVASMHGRLTEGRGIHLRDPLFREVFRSAAKVSMVVTDTDKGVRVVETSEDPFVAVLIRAHAAVVSRFIEHGHAEVRRDHPVPPRPE